MLQTIDYNLPDIQLLNHHNRRFLTWIPDKTYIVLGASNRPEESLYVEKVVQDNITVLKRPSGGQTVILTPNNLLIATVFHHLEEIQTKEIFNQINQLLITAFENAGISGLSLKGISDIAIADKKILGSAMYKNKDALLYHAVLNMGEPAATFEKYLKHPSKEPDYRNGRSHKEFVTSLKEMGFAQSYQHIENIVLDSFKASFS